jgi:FkbM family methyltransferase
MSIADNWGGTKMMIKSTLYPVFDKACRLVEGKGIGNIPGVRALYRFLFRHFWPGERIVEVQGSKMYMDLEKLPELYWETFRSYITSRHWEEPTTAMFKRVVKEGDVVVDLGANIGYFTLLAARLVGKKGKVYAFEPEPINYSLLTKNIKLNRYDNVVPEQKAVSNVKGMIKLFLSDKDTGAHTLRQHHVEREFATKQFGAFVEVESVVLDDYFKNRERSIDVIKMDIEGAEVAALSGMDRILKENQDLKIFSEFYPSAIREFGDLPEEFARKLMDDYHFSLFAIDYIPRRAKGYLKVNNVDELMSLLKGREVVNLFLERQ